MTATLTTRYTETFATAEFERIAEWAKELPLAARTGLMLVGAPLVGLAFVIALPVAGLGAIAYYAVRAARK